MCKHKFLRRALAVLAACLLLGAACLAGLAKALPDTFYIDGALTDLKIASMPFLSVAQPRQGSVAADNAVACGWEIGSSRQEGGLCAATMT